jgi:hypothetical protein
VLQLALEQKGNWSVKPFHSVGGGTETASMISIVGGVAQVNAPPELVVLARIVRGRRVDQGLSSYRVPLAS